MKIGVIIPDRSDRPKFLNNCMRMLRAQTVQPDIVEVVNFPATWSEPDITLRYRTGYDALRGKGLDCIFLIENDDWYHSEYIERMIAGWISHGRPQLFGNQYTLYYNLKLKSYFQFDHFSRSSAMNTLIVPDLNFEWCDDKQPYTDSHLWIKTKLSKRTFNPGQFICMGIKHGEGLTGGKFHFDLLHRYINKDENFDFLKQHMDAESYEFYTNYYK